MTQPTFVTADGLVHTYVVLPSDARFGRTKCWIDVTRGDVNARATRAMIVNNQAMLEQCMMEVIEHVGLAATPVTCFACAAATS